MKSSFKAFGRAVLMINTAFVMNILNTRDEEILRGGWPTLHRQILSLTMPWVPHPLRPWKKCGMTFLMADAKGGYQLVADLD